MAVSKDSQGLSRQMYQTRQRDGWDSGNSSLRSAQLGIYSKSPCGVQATTSSEPNIPCEILSTGSEVRPVLQCGVEHVQ